MLQDSYLQHLLDEKDLLDCTKSIHSIRLLDNEIERVKSGKPKRPRISENAFEEEVITISEKIYLPIKDFPKVNFVKKLLGPKGTTLEGI